MKYKIKRLDNKSRQGLYVYFNSGGKSRYYKLNELDQNITPFIKYYKKKYVDGEEANLKEIKKYYSEKKPIKEYKKKYGKRVKESMFKKSIKSVTTENVYATSNEKINKLNQDLLSASVKDPEIRKIVAEEQNMVKLKGRIQHKIFFYDIEDKIMGSDILASKYTLKEIVNKIKENVKRGEYIDKTRAWHNINNKLGTKIKDGKTGSIKRIKIVTTFTKG